MEFSFIIPAHNCATTIERAINSIIDDANISGFDSYEIIIVENGSTDNTLDICEAIAAHYSRVKVLRSKLGVSAARNEGMRATTADWILFVDADDRWLKGSFKKIYSEIKTYHADLTIYGFKKGNKIIHHTNRTSCYTSDEELIEIRSWMIKRPTLRMQVWGKVYKGSKIRETQTKFNELLSFSEDGDFLIRYTSKCNTLLLSDKVIYEYMIDTPSATRNSANQLWKFKTQGYLDAMKASCKSVQLESAKIRRAFAEYVLIHLNLILVRDVFEVKRRCTWKIRMKEMHALIKTDIFSDALNIVKVYDCLNFQLLPELFFKCKICFISGMLSYIKSFINYRKEKRTCVH